MIQRWNKGWKSVTHLALLHKEIQRCGCQGQLSFIPFLRKQKPKICHLRSSRINNDKYILSIEFISAFLLLMGYSINWIRRISHVNKYNSWIRARKINPPPKRKCATERDNDKGNSAINSYSHRLGCIIGLLRFGHISYQRERKICLSINLKPKIGLVPSTWIRNRYSWNWFVYVWHAKYSHQMLSLLVWMCMHSALGNSNEVNLNKKTRTM